MRAELESGLIDRLKQEHNFGTDEQLAAAIRCDVSDIEELRNGAEPSYVTILAIATVTGRETFDFVRRVAADAA
ncbi:XRE family transcriptional regulator [Rhodococcus zopfii]|uniref:XRE family transcriptional regulator n=1 Tax=Rhodococcus zopfii TaxID=43772 RepID=A0ABU3WTY6_9NOCA|nr:XRE family transcriptional regulator [Rhodococcus zopfii]